MMHIRGYSHTPLFKPNWIVFLELQREYLQGNS